MQHRSTIYSRRGILRQQGGSTAWFLVFLAAVAVGVSVLFHYLERPAVEFRLAEQTAARRDFSAASEHYRRALAGGWRTATARLHYAEALLALERFDEAQPQLEAVLREEPWNISAVRELAGIYQHLQRPEAAAAVFEEYLKHRSDLPPDARLHLARVYRQTKQYDRAEAQYRAMPENDPDIRIARRELAEMLSWQRRYDEAVQIFRALLEADPRDRGTRMDLARVLSWSGKLRESQEQYRQLVE